MMNRIYLYRLLSFLAFSCFISHATAQSFSSSGLVNENVNSPTSLQFGPNGKLYVSERTGKIWEFTIARDDAAPGFGTYTVTSAVPINDIKTGVPNHNDDGSVSTLKTRQVTGLHTAGTAMNPILYVSSSDAREGGAAAATDTNLDTNSGVLSRLTWNGSGWDRVDLVRGLPRCEENHSTNGLDIFQKAGSTYIMLQQGGNANEGAPSNNFAGTIETYLSGAMLIVNLTQLESMPVYTDPRNGAAYVYDLPTLNDPTRADIDNTSPNFPYPSGHPMFNATIDIGDPFGGNDAVNQAFTEAGGPVQIFSPGYRNAYDVLVTADGRIFSADNGGNDQWGGPPVIRTATGAVKGDRSTTTYDPDAGDYITNEFNISPGEDIIDALHYVGTINDPNNSYYAGHPVPIRAFPSRAGIKVFDKILGVWQEQASYNWTDLIIGVRGYFNTGFSIADFPDDPRQGEFLSAAINSPKVNILDLVSSSTNGLCEYTATNFGGAMVGDLLTASFSGNINRYQLDGTGTGLVAKNNSFGENFGSQPLDVIAQGDDDVFPGTIWAVNYGTNNITVFEPADFGTCLQPNNPGYVGTEDYDFDGYTNADEVLNGTDHCSGASKPNDNDLDFISDFNDLDDDNDGIPDLIDVFALDADNGTNTNLPISYPFWNDDPGTGFAGLGFTGWMVNGATDYREQYDLSNLSFGGAGGKATITSVPEGDAFGFTNTQENGFQFGVNVDTNSPVFTVQSKIENPFIIAPPVDSQSYGIFIGTGDQDNYLKVVIMEGTTNGDGISGFEVVLENAGTPSTNKYDVPNLLATSGINIYINVNPAANTAQPYYSLDDGTTVVPIGTAITLPTSFLNANDTTGMAVGLISTSAGPGAAYNATWDFINVTEDGPAAISVDPNPVTFGSLAINSGVAEINAGALNTGGPSTGVVQITNVEISGPDAGMFATSLVTPQSVGPGSTFGIPVRFTPNGVAGQKVASLVITHSGVNSPQTIPLGAILTDTDVVNRINAGGQEVTATDGQMNWAFNADTGAYVGGTYTVNTGLTYNSNLTFANRHPSIPASMSESTFEALFAQERYDPSGGADMNFSVPVPNGTYTVNLFMGNSYSGTSQVGQRVFDIALEGDILKNDLDLITEFGDQSGGMLSLQTEVTDGVLNIVFLEEIESPLINAIEVLAGGSPFPPLVIQPIDNITGNEGDQGTFLSVNAAGGDPNENLAYSISGQPVGVDIEPENGQVMGEVAASASTGGPSGNGVYTVTISVSKAGSNPDTETFVWRILSDDWIDKNESENYTARHECSFVQAGDKFYLMGGRENAQTVDVYDYASNTWVNLDASAPKEFNHFQATEYQGLIWVIGAFADNGFPNEVSEEFVWAFDPATTAWIQGPQIPADRRRGAAGVVVHDNKFYIVGGNTLGHNGGYVPWFDEYDPATGIWTPLANAPRARDHFHAVVLANKLYVAGGRQSGEAGEAYDIANVFTPTIPEVDVYDFGSNTWNTLPAGQNIPTPRGGAAAVNFDGKLVVIGGEVQEQVVYGTSTTDALPITEAYDPTTQTWTRLDDLNNKRHGTQAITSGNGIFVLGGSNTLGGGNQKNMEYLGADNPAGSPSVSSNLSAPANVIIADETIEVITLNVGNGTVGVFVSSMEFSGPDATDFNIVSGELTNQLLNVNSSQDVSVVLSGTGENRSATLTINYGNGDFTTINLANFDNNLSITDPGTQNNNEGDTVSLQIQSNGSSTYSATGLPPTVTINAATGLISGTISSGGGNNGAFQENNGLIVIEAESGTSVPTWQTTTIDGATGIIAGSDHLKSINGGTIPYELTVSTPGVYRFTWRSFFSGGSPTDENDNWLRFPNNNDVWFFGFKGTPASEASLIANVSSANPTNIVFPKGSSRLTPSTTPNGDGSNGYFKVFRAKGVSEVYDWQAKTSDFNPQKTNDSNDIYVWFVNAGTYTMELSERSAGHAIDKIALFKVNGTKYTDAQLTAATESQRESGPGAAANSPYTVTVSVADGGTPPSTANTQFTWYVGEFGDPIALAEATPTTGFAPLEVAFTGSNSTDDVGITSFLWDFKDGSPSVTTQNPFHTFTGPGTYEVELTVGDVDGNESTTTKTIVVKNPAVAGDLRINAGGPALSFNGLNWSEDTYFNGGLLYERDDAISNTSNDVLYQTERYSSSGTLIYEIPVVVGDYNVNLHFAELFFGVQGGAAGGVGSRVFNINIENGQAVKSNYDIVAEAGDSATAVVESFQNITVNDGSLTITLTSVTEFPKISGIEVLLPNSTTVPEVYAGDDRTIRASNTTLTLDGSARDPDGGAIASYVWTQVAGPNAATFNATTVEDPLVSGLVEGEYIFRLTATDDEDDSAFDEVTITVSGELRSQLINAGGPNITFNTEEWMADNYFMGGEDFTKVRPIENTENDELYQTERFGKNGTAVVYEIPVMAQGDYNVDLHFVELYFGLPGFGINGGIGSRVFNIDVENGQVQFNDYDIFEIAGGGGIALIESLKAITVNDGNLTVTLTAVTENPKISAIGVFETGPPKADAGADKTINLPTNTVTLNGGGIDPDGGTIATFQWTQVSGPGNATLIGATTADITANNLMEGKYVFRLTVTDDEGVTDFDEVSVTVVPEIINGAPTAVASATPLSGDAPLQVSFTGSNSTDDVLVETYAWDFKDGNSSSDADPLHTFTTEGSYEVVLTVTDADGLSDTKTLTITVGAASSNTAPIAIATAKPVSGNTPLEVSFVGSNSMDDVGVVSYSWNFDDGTALSTEADPIYTFKEPGTYTVQLTVTDGEGLTDTFSLEISVTDANGNVPPIAVAEAHTTEGNARLLINFTGSNSTGSTGGLLYSWDFGDGTELSSEADPQHIYELPGSYTATLTVTDENELTDMDILTITVGNEGDRMEIRFETNPPLRTSNTIKILVVNRPDDLQVMNITIHDIGGRYINGYLIPTAQRDADEYEIAISNLKDGVYLVRVVLSSGETTLVKLMISN